MKHFQILYADDESNDIFFVKRALARACNDFSLAVVPDGLLAIEYLAGNNEYIDRSRFPLPDLVLTDLRMPRVSGLGLLRWIRQQPFLDSVPVIILSSWGDPWDIKTACELGANGFIVKSTVSRDLTCHFKQLLELCSNESSATQGWLSFPGNQDVPQGEVYIRPLRQQLASLHADEEGVVRRNTVT